MKDNLGRPATKVLVVDDDPLFRDTTMRILAGHGYGALGADGARRARHLLEEEPDIEAVLCDVNMPEESGMELLADLTVEFPDLPVVMVTANAGPQAADAAFRAGAFGYLVKPFDTTELLIGLQSALRRQELEQSQSGYLRSLEEAVERTRSLDAVLEAVGTGPASADECEDLISRLSSAVAPRDEARAGEMARIGRYAVVLAHAVGLGEHAAQQMCLAAALHDVGKLGVPDAILLKPGPLSDQERVSMRRHARIGYQLLAGSTSPALRLAADVAWSHHEWWDGSGYPRGLRGYETSIEAQIVGLVDVFESLTSDRAYRAAGSIDDAVLTMRELRGRRFDSSLLDVFLSQLDRFAAIHGQSAGGARRIRVVVVDDHEIFADSLVRMLRSRSDMEIVGTAGGVAEAVAIVGATRPDVVLMDFELPDGNGAAATEQIKGIAPATKVIMLTMRTDDDSRVRSLAAGCSGFVRKDESVDSLLDAIVAVDQGEISVPAAELDSLLRRLEPTHRGLGAAITPREFEVLGAMAAGLVNKEIAQRLGVRLNTVRNHVQNILYKLEVHSQLEAVATAVREGLIGPPGR